MIYFVYILECSNGAYYTGYTTDIERRYQEHLSGSKKCKYTRSFPPKRIAACWKITGDFSLVLKVECRIKTLSKKKKSGLTNNPKTLMTDVMPDISENALVLEGVST